MAQDYLSKSGDFEWQRRAAANFVGDVIYEKAQSHPDDAAIIWTTGQDDTPPVTISFSALKSATNRAAALLDALGLGRGDVVLLIASRQLAWWEIILACLQRGIVVSPGTTQLTAKDITYRLRASGAKAIFTISSLAKVVDEAAVDMNALHKISIDGVVEGWRDYERELATLTPLEEVADTQAHDHALYFFTSGTTGEPKMTVHGHSYPFCHETTGRFWVKAARGKVIWNISDTGWAKAAWTSLFAPWICGAAIFALHQDGFDPDVIIDCLNKYPITTLCAPPTAYRMFVRNDVSGCQFKSLERCVSAGEPLNPEVIELWKQQTGLDIFEGYGQTETVILCGSFDGMEIRPGSMGLPAPGVVLDVIDHEGNPMPAGEEGDIAVNLKPHPPLGMFLEYKDDAKRTQASFKNGWYLTGDRAIRDGDGYFWFVGRSDDVILSSGYRIGPFEVESVLFEHEAVAESAVVASPDPMRGEVVKAFIVLAQGVKGDEQLVKTLQDYAKQTTAPYKYPRKIEFVDSLPKTVSGKIKRNELKKQEWKNVK